MRWQEMRPIDIEAIPPSDEAINWLGVLRRTLDVAVLARPFAAVCVRTPARSIESPRGVFLSTLELLPKV